MNKFKKYFSILLLCIFTIGFISPSYAALTFSNLTYENSGSQRVVFGRVSFDSSYPTGGELVTPGLLGLNTISQILIPINSGLAFGYDVTNKKILAYQSGGVTPAGTNSTSAVTGTGTGSVTPLGTNGTSAVTGTGTFVGVSSGSLDLTTPAFNGTGFSTAGQVVTTTDNKTMALNECAGMWLIADALSSTAPVLIISNTAVTGAPAVLTVVGTAPVTDAGTYKIVKNILPTGSVTALSATAAAQTFSGSSSVVTVSSLSATAAAQTFTGAAIAAGALAEVPNTTNLASLTSVPFMMIGK